MGARREPLSFASLTIIWWAVFGSAFAFIAMLQVVERPPAMTQPELLPVLALVAASTCAVGTLLPGRLFSMGLKAQHFATVEVPDPDQPAGFGAARKVPQDPERAKQSVLRLYATKTVLGAALGESVGLFGFVLSMLGAALAIYIPFFIAGAIVQAFHYPRVSAMLKEAESATGIRFET